MPNLHLEGLGDLELAEVADQALASLHARYESADDDPTADGVDRVLGVAIGRACDVWDQFADLLPGFREP